VTVSETAKNLRYAFILLEHVGVTERGMDKIKSVVKNDKPEFAEALDMIYAEDVN